MLTCPNYPHETVAETCPQDLEPIPEVLSGVPLHFSSTDLKEITAKTWGCYNPSDQLFGIVYPEMQ